MITGDKLETAENIGYSCNLFSKNMEVFRINCEMDSIQDHLERVLQNIVYQSARSGSKMKNPDLVERKS